MFELDASISCGVQVAPDISIMIVLFVRETLDSIGKVHIMSAAAGECVDSLPSENGPTTPVVDLTVVSAIQFSVGVIKDTVAAAIMCAKHETRYR